MARINPGRHTHDAARLDGGPCVFLIGMRINRWWRPDAWVPVMAAMGPMIAELSADPDSGYLGSRYAFTPEGLTIIQHWRSTDDLYRYASDREARHRPAWSAFYRRARRVPGAVGVWHETYEASAAETLYYDMPTIGLAKVTGAVPVGAATRTAAQRLAAGSRSTDPAQAPSAPARKAAERSS